MSGDKKNTNKSIKVLIAVNVALIVATIALLILIIPRLNNNEGKQSQETLQEAVSDNNQAEEEIQEDSYVLSDADLEILKEAGALLDKGLYEDGLKILKKIENRKAVEKYFTHIAGCRETLKYLEAGIVDSAEKTYKEQVNSSLPGAEFVNTKLNQVLIAKTAEDYGNYALARDLYSKLGGVYESIAMEMYEKEARELLSEKRYDEAGAILLNLVNDEHYLNDHYQEEYSENESCYEFGKEIYPYFSIYYDDYYRRFVIVYSDSERTPVGFYYDIGNYNSEDYAFDMDGKFVSYTGGKTIGYSAGSEAIDYSVQDGYKDEADALIAKGKYSKAGPILLKLVNDKDYLSYKYSVYEVERSGPGVSAYTVGKKKYYCLRHYSDDTGLVFTLYYDSFDETPAAFHYRYANEKKYRFCFYDMAGNLLETWGN